MLCPACQPENRARAKFCEECGNLFTGDNPTARSDTDPKSEVQSLTQALTEALEQQTATSEILHVISRSRSEAQPVSTRYPLAAHCHLGLGRLYRRTDDHAKAREHLTTATTMYREMGMTFWLEKAAALGPLHS